MAKRRPLIQAILALVLLGGGQPSAFGHAFLEHAEPSVGAVLTAAPQKIVLYFDSTLELTFSGFLLLDASGRELARSGAQDEAEPTQLSLTPPPLPPGTYRILWSVVARDGHPTDGDFTFTLH